MIAPDGAVVFTHGGAEEAVEDTTLDELDEELGVIVGAEDDIEVVDVTTLFEDGLNELVEVVDATVLMQEQPLEIFDGRLEQAEAHLGKASEVVARVYVEQNGAATADEPVIAL